MSPEASRYLHVVLSSNTAIAAAAALQILGSKGTWGWWEGSWSVPGLVGQGMLLVMPAVVVPGASAAPSKRGEPLGNQRGGPGL